MKGLVFAILTIGTAMVNACAHYGFCRCGNTDDAKTKEVCGKLQAQGSASLHTFADGHSYCQYGDTTGFNNCAFRLACANGYDSDCWMKCPRC
ncbi:hypothetical protein TUN199_11637 [Pyrenophora tritici-repentis]|nr:hypothetical protein PtrV1_09807 [Pyrenophora tritici-repentis]KAF7445762.1 hypothetical protein A1F99_090530 [Pyrenophora tritici-repentis]KAI0568517.1 hypothetical protein Alg130_12076 [Pyrenophora tritici-repentis]KAI0568721.1 hypothetical protein Alg215_12026 [Pyrenophora tritici-repentis]KAI0604012.1 hypothetical protein TUN205_11741 [Pyrenophora tritici-repentis]